MAVGRGEAGDRLADPVDREDRLRQLLDRRLRRRLVRAGDDDRELELRSARPLLVQDVDRLDPVERVGERGEVGLAHVEPKDRGRDRQQEQRRAGRSDDRPAHDPPNDDRPEAASFFAVAGHQGNAQPIHPVAEDRQCRRKERQRPDDRHEHDRNRADRHRPEERIVEQEQPADRDHHGEAREEDRPTGGVARDVDRGELVAAMAPLRSESREHEQRVVDRHREPDEHDELARVRADGRHELAVEPEDPERGEQRGDREDERDDRRHDRPERDQQDDERERDRQPKRGVESAVDELLNLVVRERAVERVDPIARDRRP